MQLINVILSVYAGIYHVCRFIPTENSNIIVSSTVVAGEQAYLVCCHVPDKSAAT